MASVSKRVHQILTTDEKILCIAIQNNPVNPVANLSPDSVVLTNKRFIIYRPKILGGANFEDYIWRHLRDARLKEGFARATITFQTIKGKMLSISNLPKQDARKVYSLAQEMEEAVLEERRRREMEEKKAAAGGVVLHTPPPAAQPPPQPVQEDPVQKLQQLKNMLDAELITQEEYDAKKADILSQM